MPIDRRFAIPLPGLGQSRVEVKVHRQVARLSTQPVDVSERLRLMAANRAEQMELPTRQTLVQELAKRLDHHPMSLLVAPHEEAADGQDDRLLRQRAIELDVDRRMDDAHRSPRDTVPLGPTAGVLRVANDGIVPS